MRSLNTVSKTDIHWFMWEIDMQRIEQAGGLTAIWGSAIAIGGAAFGLGKCECHAVLSQHGNQ